ncbi:peptidoglycan-binding protein [Bacillus methanolicus]|uniref:NLP/P60 protein n=2 Tax=Bacillus methanolicus TaxID=1471 RepID=I3E8I6_BACMM|nr:peptidoglycan-binding protein [Bacillus methanolicus]AIE60078.1 NLP/P60 protein [Bacillus methanolicus MGA3]EIJ82807.1 cell wall lytic activity [Bacillus methanolicus MGA3]
MKDPVKKIIIGSTFASALFVLPSISDAALGDSDLKIGMKNDDVKQLQQFLINKGYFTYQTVTGYYGSITERAVKNFQSAVGLPQTGVFDRKTYERLTGVPQKSTAAQPAAKITLKIGSRGKEVSQLQSQLKSLGYFTYPSITNYYGTITANAVRKFQQDYGLTADGVAGQKTLNKLKEVLNQNGKTTPNNNKAEPTQPAMRLTIGSTGEEVKKIQAKLKELGYFTYPSITGYFGMATYEAVKKFQKAKKLPVTGTVDFSTYTQLLHSKPSQKKKEFNVMNLIGDAAELLGTRYQWGGTTPEKGFDCSGFLVYVFEKQSIYLPRTVALIWNAGKQVDKPSVGDLVFFETYRPGASHAGIYIGKNQFIHCGSSTGVTISNLTSKYWSDRYLGAKRYY